MDIVGVTVLVLLFVGGLAVLGYRFMRMQRDLTRYQQTKDHLVDETRRLHVLLAEAEHRLHLLQLEPEEKGLLTICSHCGRVSEEPGAWEDPSPSVLAASQRPFSHGVCPDCLAQHYPSFLEGQSIDPDTDPLL